MQHELDSFLETLSGYNQTIALSHREKGQWVELNYADLVLNSKKLASYFIRKGVKPGDKIAIISDSNFYYMISIFGSLLTGATVIPVDVKLSLNEMESILNHAEVDRIIYSENHETRAIDLSNILNKPIELESLENNSSDTKAFMPKLANYEVLSEYPNRESNQPSFLVYTSGTTSKPKGVMIGWNSIEFEAKAIKEATGFRDERLLSILPLNHMFELSGGVMSGLYIGSTVYFANTYLAQELLGMFSQKRITVMLVVPLVLELFQKAIVKKVSLLPKMSQMIFNIVVRYHKFIPQFVKNIVFKNVYKVFGPDFKGFIAGGSKLNIQSYDFFRAFGYNCLQGYGLTETSPVVSVNGPKADKRGSIGKPLPGVEVKLVNQSDSDEGVLFVKGPNVMMGYYKNPELTKSVLDTDGWFNTGDIAAIDSKGYLQITGREKDLIVLDGGKKVYPEEIEQLFLMEDKVEEVFVTSIIREEAGVMRERVGALIIPSEEMIETNKDSESLKEEMINIFNQYKDEVAAYKWPTHIMVDFEKLERTTTQKIKRNVVQQRVMQSI